MGMNNLFAELRKQREEDALMNEGVESSENDEINEARKATSKKKAPKKPIKEDDEDEYEDEDDIDEDDDEDIDEDDDDIDEDDDEDCDEDSDDDEDEDDIDETGKGRGYWHKGAGLTKGKERPMGRPYQGGSLPYKNAKKKKKRTNSRARESVEYEEADSIDESVYCVPVCESCGAVLGISESSAGICPHCGGDSIVSEAMKKVVRGGKVIKKKIKHNPRSGLSPAQYKALKMNLKKARKKAHKGTANRKRMKSMKIGRRKGLHEDADFTCGSCGFSGQIEQFVGGVCPDCGASLE